MNTAIYIIADADKDVNQSRLILLIERVKFEGSQYKVFSEILDKRETQTLKEELIVRVHDKEYDTILVYRLNDWSGSILRLSSDLLEMDLKGIRFVSYYENFDSFTLTGKHYMQALLNLIECKKSFDFHTNDKDKSNLNSVNNHLPSHNQTERKTSGESPDGLNYFRGKTPLDKTNRSINNPISGTGKNSLKTDNFDLIGLNEACLLTGYSKNTIYQFTSRKLIPHYKRPHGRRIFFSKRALEQWIKFGRD